MMSTVKSYVAARRLRSRQYGVFAKQFARWAAQHGETHIRTESGIAWATQTVSVAQREAHHLLFRSLRAENRRYELPQSNYFGCRKRRRVPHIYSAGGDSVLAESFITIGPRRLTATLYLWCHS